MSTTESRTLRGELYAFVRRQLQLNDSLSTDRLVQDAQAHFEGDEWVRDALAIEALGMLLPEIARSVRHQQRESASHPLSDVSTAERMARVFEHVGGGVSRTLLTMTKPDHLFAAAERESRAAGELRWAGFHRAIAKLHTDDVTPTSALPQDQVQKLWRTHIDH